MYDPDPPEPDDDDLAIAEITLTLQERLGADEDALAFYETGRHAFVLDPAIKALAEKAVNGMWAAIELMQKVVEVTAPEASERLIEWSRDQLCASFACSQDVVAVTASGALDCYCASHADEMRAGGAELLSLEAE